MMKKLLILTAALALLVGCGPSADGDVEGARAASEAMPKTAEELSSTGMPPEAQRNAAAAIQANQAQKEAMDAQAEAMKRARNNPQ